MADYILPTLHSFDIKIDGNPLAFNDPIVTGVQVLQKAKLLPTDEYLLFQELDDGQLEEIRPDESVDLRKEGREQFITFKSDRSFRFVLDGRKFEWGLPFITGVQLKRLAGVDPSSYGVWLSQRIGDDKLIGNKEKVDLQGDGTERFFTGIDTTTEGAGATVLPPEDREYLQEQNIAFEEVADGSSKAVVLKGWSLPPARFDAGAADILILLPAAYPDCAPDMFYLMPWVRLAASQRYPNAADQPHAFAGKSWQRWSRHNNAWRPGIDGIWTMVRRIERALEIAA
ncbi:multiubiquitin domain-containing protein [Rhizobium leguminosarum]|uniref:multiubiquitin domain-containing protein n=1 Tax=Rhizobium leguminosarum TaxID=384 RepID=UPI0014411AA1|nr:multiubiquitin domain-containing protein [Rhizobium leguminosarum]NKN03073.1 hypothetical protein [Rhizobium leguminosarum bv. viciae]